MTTTTAPRLIGAALLTHYAMGQRMELARSEIVRRAGYTSTRDDGTERLYFTEFYGAILEAQRNPRSIPADWKAQPAGTIGATPRMLAWIATPNGEPIGPGLSIPTDRQSSRDTGNSYDERTLGIVRQWADDHAAEILAAVPFDDAAQGPAAVVMISDAEGTETLLEVWRRQWIGPAGPVVVWNVAAADTLPAGIEICAHCGALTTEGESETVDGETACSACHEDATPCAECGERFTSDEMTETADGDNVCSDCLSENYTRCSISDEWHPNGETVDIYGGGVWYNGARHSVISRTEAERLMDSGYLWFDQDGDYTAEEPEPDDDNEHQGDGPAGCRQYGYHTDPHDVLNIDKPNTKHRHGAELEYKGAHPCGYNLSEAMGHAAILTADSTVTGEVVTACLTMGELRRRLATIAEALAGTRNDSTTGLHLHTDRQALTPWQWWGLIRYTQTHADTLSAIAGRDCTTYGSFRHTVAQDWPSFANAWRNSNGPRYVGWNITPHTVELRACRASKTPWRILARLAMLQRLIAIGRLPDSVKPNADELMGWLAQDPNIQRQTGWEANTWSYRTASAWGTVPSDLPPWERISEAERRAATIAAWQVASTEIAVNRIRRMQWRAEDRTRYGTPTPDSAAARVEIGALRAYEWSLEGFTSPNRATAAEAQPLTD